MYARLYVCVCVCMRVLLLVLYSFHVFSRVKVYLVHVIKEGSRDKYFPYSSLVSSSTELGSFVLIFVMYPTVLLYRGFSTLPGLKGTTVQ